MKLPKAAVLAFFLPQCMASDTDAAATPRAEVAAVIAEHKQIFEALFPDRPFDENSFPYSLKAPVNGRGEFRGETSAGPFTLSVFQEIPIDLQALLLAAHVKEGAALHGLRMTGVLARIATPAACTTVYGVALTQESVGGRSKFLLGGLLSAVEGYPVPKGQGLWGEGLCSFSPSDYSCEEVSESLGEGACRSSEFENYQHSMVSACVAFQTAMRSAEQRCESLAAESVKSFAASLATTASFAWPAFLADGSYARAPILAATATWRGQLLAGYWARSVAMANAAVVLRATQERVKADFLDKFEASRKN